MKSILFSIAIILTTTYAQAQVSDSTKRTQSRRPTINQSQEKPSDKELLELQMNRKRNKGSQADTTSASDANARKQPGENKALKNDVNQAGGDSDPNSPTNSNAVSIFETGTSSAGSPGTLSDNDGRERDGTNTVQRSTPNMAGSPAPRRGSASASSARSEKASKNSNDKQSNDVKSDEKAVKDKAEKSKDDKNDKNKDKDKESKDKKSKSKKKDKDSTLRK